MMEDLHYNQETYIILDNKSSDEKQCEFEVTFPNTIYLNGAYECALIQTTLPNNLYINKFPKKYKIYLNMVWVKSFKYSQFEENAYPFDKETSQDYLKSKIIELEIGPNILGHKKFIREFEKVVKNQKTFDEINDFYKKRFSGANITQNLTLIWPQISYQNGKFKNKQGGVRFTGILKDIYNREFKAPKYTSRNNLDFYKDFKKEFHKHKIMFLYLTFNEELHEKLGFDPNFYPNIKLIEVADNNSLQQLNEGSAKYKVDLDWFDPIYMYCDIVSETYCGNVKANILKIFQRYSMKESEVVDYSFDNLMFIRLRVNEIHSIKISCADSTGEIPTFENGFISLSLLLRPLYDNNYGRI